MYSSYGNAVGRYQACSRVLLMKGFSNVIIVIFWNVRMSSICINIYVLYVSMFRLFSFFSAGFSEVFLFCLFCLLLFFVYKFWLLIGEIKMNNKFRCASGCVVDW